MPQPDTLARLQPAVSQDPNDPYASNPFDDVEFLPGLGLAVVKKIADDHGARIAISNRIDDGQIQGAQVSLSVAVAG